MDGEKKCARHKTYSTINKSCCGNVRQGGGGVAQMGSDDAR